MQYIVKREEMQAIDAYTIEDIGIPSMVLMERAAMAVTKVLVEYAEELELPEPVRVLIVTEGGNNGGDGLAIARMLSGLGMEVQVWQIGGIRQESEQYIQQKDILKKLGIPVYRGVSPELITEWKKPRYDIIVDAIFGVGLKREVVTPQKEVIEALNELEGLKCAVDIPSGIDSTGGKVLGTAFRADVTVTFGAMKLGMVFGEGAEYCGDVLVADIGFPSQAVLARQPECYYYEEHDLIRLPKRKTNGNKGTFGKVTVIAGSADTCGAAVLSATAAYRTGCGLVEVVTHKNNREAIQKHLPEALLHVYETEEQAKELIRTSAEWADILVAGPGIGITEIGISIVKEVLLINKPLILDADAITILSEHFGWWKERIAKLQAPVVITPHMKEMERISKVPMEQLKEEPWNCARKMSDRGFICVCKDARTVVTEPRKDGCYINLSGNDGMAVGGSGDVLTGVIAGLFAQGLSLGDAARLGVYIHGLAGDMAAERFGHYSMLAGDIVTGLMEVLYPKNS